MRSERRRITRGPPPWAAWLLRGARGAAPLLLRLVGVVRLGAVASRRRRQVVRFSWICDAPWPTVLVARGELERRAVVKLDTVCTLPADILRAHDEGPPVDVGGPASGIFTTASRR